jgi:hypothetical protein
MKKYLYIQCSLTTGILWQTSWIPKEFAVKGRKIDLKEGAEWSRGWVVVEAYDKVELDHKTLLERSQDYKRTRKASDI